MGDATVGDAIAGGSETAATNDDLLMACGEARGALLDIDAITSGRKPVDTSSLSGVIQLRRLADQSSAPEEVGKDLERLRDAGDAWADGLRAIEPRFADGRVVEPDTSELDRTLINEVTPVGQRLAAWVHDVCDS